MRHGETQYNTENRLQGWSDSPLTKKGIDEAKKLGEEIKDMEFDAIYSSDLKRAMDTADIININNAPRFTDKRLREWHLGNFEGKKLHKKFLDNAYIIAKEKGNVDKYFLDGYSQAIREMENPGEIENNDMVRKRFIKSLKEIGKKGNEENWESVLVVAHGFSILTTLSYLDEDLETSVFRVPNLMIINIGYDNEKDKLELITDINSLNID